MARARSIARVLLINVAAVLAVITAVAYFGRPERQGAESPQARLVFDTDEPVVLPDGDLGYRPRAGTSTRSRFYFADELIYDVRYTIDGSGLRVTPAPLGDAGDDCVLLFGGSYAFGTGVDDVETMPYLVGVAARDRYRVRNFGFRGYGPHQMLAAIDSGLVERAADCTPRIAVYMSQYHHAKRAAGKFLSDTQGPRYVLRDGAIVRDGNFDDVRAAAWFRRVLSSWQVGAAWLDSRPIAKGDVELLRAIVARCRDLLARRYPGIEFHILYWGSGDPDLFDDALDGKGIVIHRLGTVFPLQDYEKMAALYQIPHDGHPNAHAHAVLADYVMENVIGR